MATAPAEQAAAGWTVLQVRRTFDAPRDRVFEAWTDPELLRQWLTGVGTSPGADVDARVGGEFRITMESAASRLLGRLPGPASDVVQMVGRYLEISPPERLVFTMGWEDFPTVHMDSEASTVTVEFHEKGEGTEMVLTHERQPSRRIRSFHRFGWKTSFRKLAALLARGS
jgi:uncharacterized protein YndB with AHSA1/START domain